MDSRTAISTRSKDEERETRVLSRLTTISPARRQLVERFRRLQFGLIHGLHLRGGEPWFRPAPRIFRDGKLSGRPEPPSTLTEDFALKAQWVELFALFSELGEARFEFIEFKEGLPFRYRVETPDDDLGGLLLDFEDPCPALPGALADEPSLRTAAPRSR